MCERNFEIKIEKEIEINDLIKINLCLKKDKMNIKKCYNVFFYSRFFIISNSREFDARAY